MPTHSYYVVADDCDGESRDLFVTALSPAGALDLWVAYYEMDLEEVDYFEQIRVFLVPTRTDIPTAHAWQEPVLEIHS
jgi:hypothetical protein